MPFFHTRYVNMPKLSRLLPKEIKQLKFETQHLGCNFRKFQLKAFSVFSYVLTIPGLPIFLPILLSK